MDVHVVELGRIAPILEGWVVRSQPQWVNGQDPDEDTPVGWHLALYLADAKRATCSVRNDGLAHASAVVRMVALACGPRYADALLDVFVERETQYWTADMVRGEDWEHL